jgi:multidrug transporter EmrE-like cation transporter
MKPISRTLLLVAIFFEAVADVLFKEWSIDNKAFYLVAGLAIYFISTVGWAYSLRHNLLSKAITIFTVLNLLLVLLAGYFIFNERLSTPNKVGVVLGVISVILLQV